MCEPCPHDASTYQLVAAGPGRGGAAHAAAVPTTRWCGGSTRQPRQRRRRAALWISVGVIAHVITAIAPRSDGLSRATHVQIASRVTALQWLCVMVLCRVFDVAHWRPLRCGCRSKFKQSGRGCVTFAEEQREALQAKAFCAIFLLPQFRGVRTPRTRSTTQRPEPKPPRTTPKRPAPGA